MNSSGKRARNIVVKRRTEKFPQSAHIDNRESDYDDHDPDVSGTEDNTVDQLHICSNMVNRLDS